MYVRFVASAGSKTVGSRLRTEVPVISAAEQQRAEEHADRGVAPEQRDRDAEEAELVDLDVVGGDPELPAEHVERARQPRERAADRHHDDVVAAHGDARGLRRVRVEADRAHLEAERRAVEQHPEDEQRRERDEQADVQALQLRVAPEHRQLRALDDVVGDRHVLLRRVVVLQRAAEVEQVDRRSRSRSS